jgi:hypothetical protein
MSHLLEGKRTEIVMLSAGGKWRPKRRNWGIGLILGSVRHALLLMEGFWRIFKFRGFGRQSKGKQFITGFMAGWKALWTLCQTWKRKGKLEREWEWEWKLSWTKGNMVKRELKKLREQPRYIAILCKYV